MNFSQPVIKTRKGATEASCLGYRRAAGVKGDIGLNLLLGKTFAPDQHGTSSIQDEENIMEDM